MLRPAAILGALILSASCNKTESSDSATATPVSTTPTPAKAGSGGGFSADLAKELGSGSDAPKAGSDAVAAGSDAPKPGDVDKPASAVVAAAGRAAKPEPEPAKPGGDVGSAAPTKPAPVKAGSAAPTPGSAATGSAGSAAPIAKPSDTAKPAASEIVPPKAAPPSVPSSTTPAKVTADLAAIKLSLLPNWDRDIGEAGTFQYVVRIKGTQNTKTFAFHYGYDDPKAPTEREQYKKYLQDTKLLTGELKDRQRGAAWFLEGADASGAPAFRYQVLYGGKRLICYGSLYRDAESSRLGDDRDQTVIQAKQICETLAL